LPDGKIVRIMSTPPPVPSSASTSNGPQRTKIMMSAPTSSSLKQIIAKNMRVPTCGTPLTAKSSSSAGVAQRTGVPMRYYISERSDAANADTRVKPLIIPRARVEGKLEDKEETYEYRESLTPTSPDQNPLNIRVNDIIWVQNSKDREPHFPARMYSWELPEVRASRGPCVMWIGIDKHSWLYQNYNNKIKRFVRNHFLPKPDRLSQI
jgi:hypothetical protein